MAKRRTRQAKARADKRASREAGMSAPGGRSKYAKKKIQQTRGRFSEASPFTADAHEQAGPRTCECCGMRVHDFARLCGAPSCTVEEVARRRSLREMESLRMARERARDEDHYASLVA